MTNKNIKEEVTNESIKYRAILEYKKFILENSKPAPKDSVYGNKLNPYLEAIDFAIYAILRGKDFKKGIHSEDKAKVACEVSGHPVSDHFVDVNKMVDLGSGSRREVDDLMLTRYACYLIAQNGDSKIRKSFEKFYR